MSCDQGIAKASRLLAVAFAALWRFGIVSQRLANEDISRWVPANSFSPLAFAACDFGRECVETMGPEAAELVDPVIDLT